MLVNDNKLVSNEKFAENYASTSRPNSVNVIRPTVYIKEAKIKQTQALQRVSEEKQFRQFSSAN
jgi:hypothetical protein